MKFWQSTDLPAPCSAVVQTVQKLVHNYHPDPEFVTNIKQLVLHDKTINVASSGQIFDKMLDRLVQIQYQKFFSIPVRGASVGYFHNTDSLPACLPPHIHDRRTVALNFFLHTGGPQVRTVLYRWAQPNCADSAFLNYFDYQNLIYHTELVCQPDRWYMFESRCPHSVENIDSTRIFLCLLFDSDLSTDSVLTNCQMQFTPAPVV